MKEGLALIVVAGFVLLGGALVAYDVLRRAKKRRRKRARRPKMFDGLF